MAKKDGISKEPEVISSLPERRGDLSPALQQIGDTTLGAYFARRIALSQTASAQALTALGQSLIELEFVKDQARDMPNILAANRAERELRRITLEKQLTDAKREAVNGALIAQLKDELQIIELEEKVAAAKARRAQPAPIPLDEEARRREEVRKKYHEYMGRRFTEQEIRAHADQLIAAIKARTGGEITPSIQREIDNVTDVMNSLLDEL